MKQILAFLLLLCTLTTSAQDIIVKKDGTAIQAIVTEILSSDVKYKKFSNPDGPTYTVAIADLLSITYKNGEVDRFNSTPQQSISSSAGSQNEPSITDNYILDGRRTKSDAELLQIYQLEHPVIVREVDPVTKSKNLYKKGKHMKVYGWITASTLCAIAIGVAIGDANNEDVVLATAPVAVAGLAIGVPLIYAGNKKIRQSRTIQTATLFQQEFPLGKHSTLSADVNLMRDSYRNQYAPAVGFHINF